MNFVDRIKNAQSLKKESRWPGTDEVIFLHILGKDKLEEALFAADKRFRAQNVPVEMHTIEAFKDEETVQILYRAITDAEGKPPASSIDTFRPLLTAEVQTALANQYTALETETSPNIDRMDDEAFAAFAAELKKNPDAILSSVSNGALLKRLVRSLVAELQS